MIPGQCLLCLDPASEYVANKVVKKGLTNIQAAKEMGVPLDVWVSHYELHIRNKLINVIAHDIEPIKNNLLDKIKEGTESVKRVISLTKKISERLKDKDVQNNTKLISAYAQLEKNLISGLKELAILEGDINQATTINIQNNTLKVDKLMAIVMEDATPLQKEKILVKMNALTI